MSSAEVPIVSVRESSLTTAVSMPLLHWKIWESSQLIAENNNALLVIGHYYSSTSTSAGKIYKRNEIPAITASATTESVITGNEWYFRTVPGNNLEARFVVNYINKGMNNDKAGIIFSNDDYGKTLAENFEKTVKALGMQMTGKWEWDLDKEPEEQVEKIKQELETVKDQFSGQGLPVPSSF